MRSSQISPKSTNHYKMIVGVALLFFCGCNVKEQFMESPIIDGPIVCEKFTVVVLPDTQIYSKSYPEIFTSQTKWIVNNKEKLNIQAVIHVGDIVDCSFDEKQWENADKSLSLLDGIVPYFVVPGDHDMSRETKDSTLYNVYFPYWRYDIYDWYGGHYPDNKNNNSYGFFTVGDKEFLIIGLEFCPNDKTIEWADSILKEHKDKTVILFTHAYLNENNTRIDTGDPSDCARWAFCQGECNNGQGIWGKLVSKYSNVLLVLSGHVTGDGLGMRTDYVEGQPIHQVLQNYQMLENGGNGYLRCYEFDYNNKVIKATTYSPHLDKYKRDGQNEFKLEWK